MLASRVLDAVTTRTGRVVDGTVVAIVKNVLWRNDTRTPHALDDLVRLAELYGRHELIEHPERFYRAPPPARVRAHHRGDHPAGAVVADLDYASDYEPYSAAYRDEHASARENLTAHARWYKHGRPRRTVICVHGMGGGPFALEERAFLVPLWLASGYDVVLFQLPFHAARRPRRRPNSRFGEALFPSSHLARTNEAFGQAISDLRALIGWLRLRDVPDIGVMGQSLGGYTTALLASLDPDLSFAVPMIPAACLTDRMWSMASPHLVRAAREAGITEALFERIFQVHSPLARRPRIPWSRRFFVAAQGDQICPAHHATALWEHWGKPPIHWFPGGHLAQVGRMAAFQRVLRWLGGDATHGSGATPAL